MEVIFERKGLEKKFFEKFVPAISEVGLQLYDLEYLPGQSLLRIYIQNPESKTATIDDCIKVDHLLSPYFESESWIPETITLEVSSPGVYRNLRNLDQVKSSLNEVVSCVIMGKLDYPELPKKHSGPNKFRGKLTKANEEEITLEIDGEEVFIALQKIKKINVDPDLK